MDRLRTLLAPALLFFISSTPVVLFVLSSSNDSSMTNSCIFTDDVMQADTIISGDPRQIFSEAWRKHGPSRTESASEEGASCAVAMGTLSSLKDVHYSARELVELAESCVEDFGRYILIPTKETGIRTRQTLCNHTEHAPGLEWLQDRWWAKKWSLSSRICSEAKQFSETVQKCRTWSKKLFVEDREYLDLSITRSPAHEMWAMLARPMTWLGGCSCAPGVASHGPTSEFEDKKDTQILEWFKREGGIWAGEHNLRAQTLCIHDALLWAFMLQSLALNLILVGRYLPKGRASTLVLACSFLVAVASTATVVVVLFAGLLLPSTEDAYYFWSFLECGNDGFFRIDESGFGYNFWIYTFLFRYIVAFSGPIAYVLVLLPNAMI